ncbi:alpha/beta fold hydrolase [Acidisoma silvae]|uniref:Alpha/beta hydrolase n=1 Tax=Acidisoma silvae TaxID=2802396 RepID=A0A963YWZ8_9PROT|nr:alpha/beta hydrolase [Acidisoma silvae]MCB8877917.1 alpha/beta hydrolase [Acidisoma silvae]
MSGNPHSIPVHDQDSSAQSVTAATAVPAEMRPTLQMKVGSGAIAFDDTGGSGPLVIAVPGMGDVRNEYRYLTPYLIGACYRVVTVDLRGHGASSPRWSDYSARSIGGDLLSLMAHLGSEEAIIIGNSFTAGAAMWAANDAPTKVKAAILIGPVLRDPPNGIPWYLRAVLSIGFSGPWRVRFWLWYFKSLFPMRKPADFASYCTALGENLREPGRMIALKNMLNLSKSDTERMLHKVEMPVLVVMGTKDADFPDPAFEANWVADRIGAQLLIIKGAGHYPHTEMPEQVGPAIVNFLGTGKA